MLRFIYEAYGMEKLFIAVYMILFTLPYLISFLMFYIFGYSMEKKMRVHTEIIPRVAVPDGLRFLFHFKNVDAEKKMLSSVIGVYCEAVSVAYFVVMEAMSLLLVAIKKDCIIACRISFVMFALMTVLFVVMSVYTSKLLKKGADMQQQYEEKHLFDENETLDIESADEYVNTSAPISEKEEKMREMVKELIDETESEFDTETVDINQGKKIVSDASNHLTDFRIYK